MSDEQVGQVEARSTTADSREIADTRIAHVAHEANRAYCWTIGDDSQPPWFEAPTWQVQSAIAGVRFLREHPDATPADSHGSWLAEKERDGWTYGSVKDAAAKQHPCFVPYERLPPDQQAKDSLYIAVVRALLGTETPA